MGLTLTLALTRTRTLSLSLSLSLTLARTLTRTRTLTTGGVPAGRGRVAGRDPHRSGWAATGPPWRTWRPGGTSPGTRRSGSRSAPAGGHSPRSLHAGRWATVPVQRIASPRRRGRSSCARSPPRTRCAHTSARELGTKTGEECCGLGTKERPTKARGGASGALLRDEARYQSAELGVARVRRLGEASVLDPVKREVRLSVHGMRCEEVSRVAAQLPYRRAELICTRLLRFGRGLPWRQEDSLGLAHPGVRETRKPDARCSHAVQSLAVRACVCVARSKHVFCGG